MSGPHASAAVQELQAIAEAQQRARRVPAPAVEKRHALRVRLKRPDSGETGDPAARSGSGTLEVPMPKVSGDSVVMPFGGGKSKCPGRMFARNEIRLVTLAFVLLVDARLRARTGDSGKAAWPGLLKSRAGLGILPPADRYALQATLHARSSTALAV